MDVNGADFFFIKCAALIEKMKKKDEYNTYGTKEQTEQKKSSNRTGNYGGTSAADKGRDAGCHQGHFRSDVWGGAPG